MTDEHLVARAIIEYLEFDTDALWDGIPGLAAAVVAALREEGRLVPEGVTVRYGWQSGDSSPAAWSASRVAVEQP